MNNNIAQERLQLGLLPVLNVNKKLKKDFKLNIKLENRQIFYQDQEWSTPFYDRLDFTNILSKKIGLTTKIAGGYLIRFRNQEIITRTIQQFALIQKFSTLKLAHRLVTDQTFQKEKAVKYRFRYRISAQIPFNGQSIDPQEFYFKFNHEYLYALQDANRDLEIRIVPVLGYKFKDTNKLEIAFDNRLGSFIMDALETKSWFTIAWYIVL